MMQATLYDGISATAHKVTLRLLPDNSGLEFADDLRQYVWSFRDISLEEKPSASAEGRLSCRTNPDAQLLISPKIYRRIAPHLRHRLFNPRIMGSIALFIALIAATVFLVFPLSVPWLANQIPQDWEASLGGLAYSQLFGDKARCQQSAHEQTLHELAQTLSEQPLDPPLHIAIIQHQAANAVALPGNHVVIFSGLIEEAESPDELAGILAHELGHLHHRHHMESFIYHIGVTGLIDIATGGGGTITYIGLALLNSSYSRHHEREADQYAAQVLTAQRYSLKGVQTFFARHAKKQGSAEMLKWVSSHPVSEERVAFFKQHKAPESPSPALTQNEWNTLQKLEGCWPDE